MDGSFRHFENLGSKLEAENDTRRSKEEWIRLIARLERSAEDDKDPQHARWCKGQLQVVRRRFAQLFPESEPGRYRLYFISFDYYLPNEDLRTLPDAIKAARIAGFDSRIERDGIAIYAWSIIGGLRAI